MSEITKYIKKLLITKGVYSLSKIDAVTSPNPIYIPKRSLVIRNKQLKKRNRG